MDGALFFAEDIATALFFADFRAVDGDVTAARIKSPEGGPKHLTVVELTIPGMIATCLRLSDSFRKPLGEFTGIGFPDILHGSGCERIVSDLVVLAQLNMHVVSGEISVRRLKYSRSFVPMPQKVIR